MCNNKCNCDCNCCRDCKDCGASSTVSKKKIVVATGLTAGATFGAYVAAKKLGLLEDPIV